MYSVWKYTLKATEKQNIEIPMCSKILSVESQGDEIVLYALIDKEDKSGIYEVHEVRIYGTGHDIPTDIGEFDFLGTVKMYNGSLMFHVFIKV